MKITYIANARIPTERAHGIQIMKMCEAFAASEKRLEVELVIPTRFNPIKAVPFEYYGVKRNFKIKKLPCLDLIILDKYIGHLGLWIESFTFLISVFFYTLLKKTDVVYIRDNLLLPLTFFKKNIFFEGHTFSKKYSLYAKSFQKLKGIIVITEKLKESFIKKGIKSEKILTAPDGVDIKNFDVQITKSKAREKLNLPLDKKIVLYTGHLYKWKGVDVLTKAIQNLPVDVEIYFIGGTEKDIKDFKLQTLDSRLYIIGHRPYREIPYWLKTADVLVLPNSAKGDISQYWTSPLKLFEYMASGRPIIASDLPSIREILNDDNAILVKPDNPEDLANGIEKALRDRELAKRISTRAYEDVQQYSWERRTENILKFIFN